MTDGQASGPLELGRTAYQQRRWREALDLLAAAEAISPLEPKDYELLAMTQHLLSPDGAGLDVFERAHHVLLERGDVRRAVKMAFWLGNGLVNRGEAARASGWIERGRRLLDDAGIDCPERGYLRIPFAIRVAMAGDHETALAVARELQELGRRFGDRDLVIFSRMGEGRVRLAMGDIASGQAVMDEVMVSITTEEHSPLLVGMVYCSVIQGLSQVFDVGRAREWTAALRAWCEVQPDLVMFRGECCVMRSQLMQLMGEWREALEQTVEAGTRFLGPPPHPAAGSAFYHEGELHRLAGRFAEAERAYLRAAELGRNPQPGLAQLWLALDRPADAEASVRRALSESSHPTDRAGLLSGYVEIMLAVGDTEAARSGAAELASIATTTGSDFLRAAACEAAGAALLADGDPKGALAELRRAESCWRRVVAPYQTAQSRLLCGLACRELGDSAGAALEIEAARQAFVRLGALPDLARLDRLTANRTETRSGGLTGREVQLLGLLATGKTNREIADHLVISEKTVARHVSNIFNKLGVSSRAAATAYAFRHNLV